MQTPLQRGRKTPSLGIPPTQAPQKQIKIGMRLQILIRRHRPKYLLHLRRIRRPLRTVQKPLHLGQALQRLIDVPETRVVAAGPPFELGPAAAPPHLADARLRGRACGRVARSVVGVAEDVLAQHVGAMHHVAPGPRLGHALPELGQ